MVSASLSLLVLQNNSVVLLSVRRSSMFTLHVYITYLHYVFTLHVYITYLHLFTLVNVVVGTLGHHCSTWNDPGRC